MQEKAMNSGESKAGKAITYYKDSDVDVKIDGVEDCKLSVGGFTLKCSIGLLEKINDFIEASIQDFYLREDTNE